VAVNVGDGGEVLLKMGVGVVDAVENGVCECVVSGVDDTGVVSISVGVYGVCALARGVGVLLGAGDGVGSFVAVSSGVGVREGVSLEAGTVPD